MQQISSNLTWIYKYGFSSIWISGFGLGTLFIFILAAISGDPELREARWQFLFGFAFGTSLCYLLLIRLKKVTLVNDNLIISNYRDQIQINISDVEKVSSIDFTVPKSVCLYLKNETKFGRKIQFMPKNPFSLSLKAHPVVSELNSLIEMNK